MAVFGRSVAEQFLSCTGVVAQDTIFQQTMLPMSASMGQPRLSVPGGAALPPPPPPPAGQMRPQPSPSNLSLDHILMLANLTNPPPDFPGQGHAGGAGAPPRSSQTWHGIMSPCPEKATRIWKSVAHGAEEGQACLMPAHPLTCWSMSLPLGRPV
jgi:hypothetical protein